MEREGYGEGLDLGICYLTMGVARDEAVADRVELMSGRKETDGPDAAAAHHQAALQLEVPLPSRDQRRGHAALQEVPRRKLDRHAGRRAIGRRRGGTRPRGARRGVMPPWIVL